MSWKNKKGEHMEWSAENTSAFIDIVYDRGFLSTGKIIQLVSSQNPPTPDKKKEIEGAHLSTCVHTDPDAIDDVGDGMQDFDKKRKSVESTSEQQCAVLKKPKLEPTSSQLAESTTFLVKARADRSTTQASRATSSVTDPYSVDACMELLNSMEDIPSNIYNNALVKFLDKDWRHMFIKMPSFRRDDWLASLV